VLAEAARRLSESVLEYDTVCRFGADEFAVVLTDIKAQQACLPIAN
jgi:PleD family two-component response regulator